MNPLLERIKKNSTIKEADVLDNSKFFNNKDIIPTNVPAINVALSGSLSGGFTPGLTIFSGVSRNFKCLSGETGIVIYKHINDDIETIETTYENLYELFNNSPNEEFFVATHKGRLTKINAVIKKDSPMVSVHIDTGDIIHCADEHYFMNTNGNPIAAKDLIPYQSEILSVNRKHSVLLVRETNGRECYGLTIDAPHWYVNGNDGIIHHNTGFSLFLAKSYMEYYPESILLFYDSEFGTPKAYFYKFNIDKERVLHVPVTDVEQLKFDVMKQLDNLNRDDKIIIIIDSIGNLASKKEVEDALNEKSVADFSRAKQLKSFCRMVTPHLNIKNIPMIAIGHVYQEMGLFPKEILSGGRGLLYAADNVFIVGRRQEKDGSDISGYEFILNVEKSRYVREKSKIPISISYETGISKYSGLLEMAIESGHVVCPSKGWYSRVNKETGETEEKKWRAKDTNTSEFWDQVLESESFKTWIESRYKISYNTILSTEI
jgi:RecA/RadA recombinase